jgi:hypothetical protein
VYNSIETRYQYQSPTANHAEFPDILQVVDLTNIYHSGHDLGNLYYPFEKQWIAQFPTDLSTSYQHFLWRTRSKICAPSETQI